MYLSAEDWIFNERKLSLAREFFKNSYLTFIMMNPKMISKILNEYIYYMHKFFGMYQDEFRENYKAIKNRIAVCHVMDFYNIWYEMSDDINEDIKNCEEFYSVLFEYVYNVLEEKFYLGKKFNNEEKQLLIDRWKNGDDDMFFTVCRHKKIKIIFDRKKFNFSNFSKCMTEDDTFQHSVSIKKTKKIVEITIDNSDELLDYTEMWSLQTCGESLVLFSIDYYESTNKILHINALDF